MTTPDALKSASIVYLKLLKFSSPLMSIPAAFISSGVIGVIFSSPSIFRRTGSVVVAEVVVPDEEVVVLAVVDDGAIFVMVIF